MIIGSKLYSWTRIQTCGSKKESQRQEKAEKEVKTVQRFFFDAPFPFSLQWSLLQQHEKPTFL
jgi:hypothetical protein